MLNEIHTYMETTNKTKITVETTVALPVAKVWKIWSDPEDITKWCQASPEWHAPYADNDLKTGGKFKTTMAAKDGSFSFDLEGVYTNVKENEVMAYTLPDGRTVHVTFTAEGNATKIVETFDPENENPVEMQKGGWQAILDSFKNYAENK
ncbi:MAG: polyketide cyclase [Chitinophagaceae bacterium]|nr:polyketide cyclase [Chitinophagaceae bacterium]